MEPFKNLFNADSIRATASEIKSKHPAFQNEDFLACVLPQIESQEMKTRVKTISKALGEFLPEFPHAVKILTSATKSEKNPTGLSGFQVWPFTQFVEDFGGDYWKISLESLKQLTTVMSAEFAIRPFIIAQQDKTLKLLLEWTKSTNVHVRRLCSEGSRPLLPWGQRLKEIQKNPELTLPILRALKNDPELYVRKSVANHLNDITKDHPRLIVEELKKWNREQPKNKEIYWITRHALRTLIKAGDKNALALLGIKNANAKGPKLQINPAAIKMGASITISFQVTAVKKEKWLIDYIVHHKKANGTHSPKVFKWTERQVVKGPISLLKKHSFKKITTRKYHTGEHYIEIQLNGKPVIKKKFQLVTSS